jgi:tetratricopeptide (TPR) repeat protein
MAPDIERETEFKEQPEPSTEATKDVARIIDEAERRSRRIRIVTSGLLLGLIVFGALLLISVYTQDQKAKERLVELQKAQLEARKANEQQAELRKREEIAQKVSSLLANGATKARYQKHWKEALADYDQALALDPNSAGALSLKGFLEFRMGDTQSAERLLRRAVEVDPTMPWHHYNLALALWANGKKQDAVAEVEQVLKIDPSFKSIIAQDGQFASFWQDPNFKRVLQR